MDVVRGPQTVAAQYLIVRQPCTLYGGHWNERLDRFVKSPRREKNKKIACRLKDENIFIIGSACPLNELIDDDEARNGSFEFQEKRTSLTNSKWSLEHTLPRTASFAEKHVDFLELPKSK